MFFKSVVVAAAIIVSPVAASAVTLLNGSFESDPMVRSQGANGGSHGRNRVFSRLPNSGASWGIWTDGVEGWSSSKQGIEFQTERTLGLKPADGKYYVELDTQRNSWIEQEVKLSVGTYELSFAYSPRTRNPSDNGISYMIADLNGFITGPTKEVVRREWTYVTERFTVATEDLYTLRFAAEGRSNSLGGFIDDVQLSAVPVPAGMLLMGTALAGLGLVRRKKS